jgi:integrase
MTLSLSLSLFVFLFLLPASTGRTEVQQLGYVYIRGGTYYIAFKRPDGRWVRESAETDKKTLAKAMLSSREHEMFEAKVVGLPVQSDIRLEKFMEEYRDYAAANKKPSAVRADEVALKKLLPLFGKMKLREIKSGDVQRYMDQRRLVKRKNGKRLRAATIRNEVHTLSAIFREAIRRDLVQSNPCSRVKKPKEDNTIVRYLTPDEEERLFKALSEQRKPIVIVALHTGMRKGEILNLEWTDIDFDQRLILVKNTKSDRKRYIPMNDVVFETLKALPVDPESKYVFVNPKTGDVYGDIKKSWATTMRRAKIEKFRFHDLRHTFASRLVQAGIPIIVVMELLGHRDLTTTMRYAHLAPTDMRQAVEALVPKKEPKA